MSMMLWAVALFEIHDSQVIFRSLRALLFLIMIVYLSLLVDY